MPKITFIGAGSLGFFKRLMIDCMGSERRQGAGLPCNLLRSADNGYS